MFWQGDLEFNVEDAYSSHLKEQEATSQPESNETPDQTDVSADQPSPDQPSEEKETRW